MGKKIKVTFVVTNCKKTGPINQTLNIIRNLDKGVFEASLITMFPEEENNTMFDGYRKTNIKIYQAGMNKVKSILYGKVVVGNILKKIKPDIVQGVGIPPYRMTLGYKDCVHFVTLRNYCYEDYPDQYGKKIGPVLADMDMKLIRKQMSKGEPVVTCSNSLTDMYKKKQQLDIGFICNGVDVSKYSKRDLSKRAALRKALALPDDKIIFVYSGRLIDRKNQQEAIESVLHSARSSEIVLVLLGDGINRQSLVDNYRKHANVLIRGEVSNVIDYLHASDVYLSSSKSEGLPNGVLEAMAAGLPVLLSDIPQHMELFSVNMRIGRYYKLGDVGALASEIDSMLDDDLSSMSADSYKAVMNNFTAEIMSKKYQNLYKHFL
ncbi:glycosyltransferase [Desulfosporosinus sp. OT]|uniref:glycosyltransferase n=1 Tax=Desulfosporosinus sp. OT TaxID=913865 RepID=UPI000223A323|nr:glycosyltransferase [Desulfosporosinus sp. OT]EGW37820.1 glycosyl transferases group 1 family protein [Desulfosporosinus sp. OT]